MAGGGAAREVVFGRDSDAATIPTLGAHNVLTDRLQAHSHNHKKISRLSNSRLEPVAASDWDYHRRVTVWNPVTHGGAHGPA